MSISIQELFPNLDDDKDDRWCNCIVLHDFQGKNVKWQEWFEFALSFYTKHKLEPTRLGVSGLHYGNSPKTLTFKGGLKKLQKYNFENIEDLGFMVMPNKDDYTTNFIIETSLYPSWKNSKASKVVMCFDEKLEPFNKESFEKIATKLYKFTNAKYGYYYRRHLKNYPQAYPTGGNVSYIDQDDKAKCRKWELEYNYSDGSYHTGNLRDIYKLNFISQEHLDWQINDDKQTLQQWINSNPNHGILTELSSGFWSWYAPESQIPIVRNSLIPSGIILCV